VSLSDLDQRHLFAVIREAHELGKENERLKARIQEMESDIHTCVQILAPHDRSREPLTAEKVARIFGRLHYLIQDQYDQELLPCLTRSPL